MRFRLACPPPTRTAQGKRNVTIVPNPKKPGRLMPKFFKNTARRADLDEWAWLSRPYRPAVPLDGALLLHFVLVYPHLANTPKRDRGRWIPKESKPDCTNVMKAFEDMLVQQGFMVDDQRVADFRVRKYHGPDDDVGIYVTLDVIEGVDERVCYTEAVRQSGPGEEVGTAGARGQGHPGPVRGSGERDELRQPS